MKNFIVAVVALGWLLAFPDARTEDHAQKAVLITGASTGIGRHLAETLASDLTSEEALLALAARVAPETREEPVVRSRAVTPTNSLCSYPRG